MRRTLPWLLAGTVMTILALAFTAPAMAKRVALVVGINSYENLGPGLQLRKAVNDARAVAAGFKEIGFQVIVVENTRRNDFLRGWQRFLDLVEPGDVTAFYFAGHGVEINGSNYLLVRDAPEAADGEEVLRGSAIRFGSLVDRLKDKQAQVSVYFLDACRDNPYANQGSKRSIGATRGLVREDAPKGALVMMSAAAGQTALDALSPSDPNPNSVYTRMLLPLLKQPGLEIVDLAKRVRRDVEALAMTVRHEQRPAFYDELSGTFYLVPPVDTPQAPISAGPAPSEAVQAWAAIKDTNSQAILEAFIRHYGTSFFAEMARARLDELRRTQTAVLGRPSAPVAAPAPPPVVQAPPAVVPPHSQPAPAAAPPRPPTTYEAAQAWVAIKDTANQAVLEAFIQRYGGTLYTDMARTRLEELKRTQTAVAPIPAPPVAAPAPAAPPLPPPAATVVPIPAKPAAPVATTPPTAYEAAQAWLAVKDTVSVAELEAFLARFGGSIYGYMARDRLAELNRTRQAAIVTPPAPAAPLPAKPATVAPPAAAPSASQPVAPAVGVFPPSALPAPQISAQGRALKPKDVFRDCEQCPQMVVVSPGAFTMGSPAGEPGRVADEGPPSRIAFAKPFAVGVFSVTFEEWDACVSTGGCNGYRPSDAGRGRGRYPVVNVSWDDAKAYVAWLSKMTGKSYRLLSEAEREYVTRAGTTTPFWFGPSISTRQANYDGGTAYAGGDKGEYRARAVPVDTFEPNPFGLYQTHGNVLEWVDDCWFATYEGQPQDGSARDKDNCARRVLRGGSWFDPPAMLRAAQRAGLFPGYRSEKVGFRVARGP